MKDPLRYFIDEGFGCIFAYRVGEDDYAGEIISNKLNKNFTPSISNFDGKKIICFLDINPNKYYVVDREFFEKYAVIFDSRDDAVDGVMKYYTECDEVVKFMAESNHLA
jgi:hypothetical protein